MNLADVVDQLEARLATIPQMRVYPWGTAKISPPGCVVTLPDRIAVRSDGARLDRIEGLAVVALFGKANARTAVRTMAPYVASSGAKSIQAVLEGGTYTAFDEIEVESIDFELDTELAATPYLGALFTCNIVGPGGA